MIVDRSGSMDGEKIEMTKKALRLFLESLPVGSKFDIVSFGTNYRALSQDFPYSYSAYALDYNEKNLKQAKSMLDRFGADFGGTEILKPLKFSIDNYNYEGFKKRIFFLTDGSVDYMDDVINLAASSD
jgi:uncharacterized protein with von Willebrand factor type A (vWA) domain